MLATLPNVQCSGVRSTEPVGVMLLVSSLEYGGAERQIVEVVRNMDRSRFDPVVCSLSSCVPLADRLPDRERELVIVEKHWKFDTTTIPRVARVIADRRITVIHTFLYEAQIVGRLAGRLKGVRAIIASERNTDYRIKPLHAAVWRLTRSCFDAMVANSNAGKRFNIAKQRVPGDRIYVVHNGVDSTRFVPCDASATRVSLGIQPDELVVGMIASFKKQKNHEMFFRVAAGVLERFPKTWFLCVGEPLRDNQQGAADYHREMMQLVDRLGIRERVLFVGNRSDILEIYNACDVCVLTSSREGTPNVLLESMSCGVPVVATDIADNAYVVPDGWAGYIVSLNDVETMTQHVCALLSDGGLRERIGRQSREWVQAEFSPEAMTRKMEAVYSEVLEHASKRDVRGAS